MDLILRQTYFKIESFSSRYSLPWPSRTYRGSALKTIRQNLTGKKLRGGQWKKRAARRESEAILADRPQDCPDFIFSLVYYCVKIFSLRDFRNRSTAGFNSWIEMNWLLFNLVYLIDVVLKRKVRTREVIHGGNSRQDILVDTVKDRGTVASRLF